MWYGSLGCIQKLLLVRNVDLVSSLPRSKQPRYQVSLLPLLRSGEGEGREWGGGVGGREREREREEREQYERGWTVKRIIFYLFTLIDAPKTLRLARKTRVTLVYNRDLPAFTRVFPRCMYVMWILIASLDRLESLWLLDGNRYNTCHNRLVFLMGINIGWTATRVKLIEHYGLLFNRLSGKTESCNVF